MSTYFRKVWTDLNINRSDRTVGVGLELHSSKSSLVHDLLLIYIWISGWFRHKQTLCATVLNELEVKATRPESDKPAVNNLDTT